MNGLPGVPDWTASPIRNPKHERPNFFAHAGIEMDMVQTSDQNSNTLSLRGLVVGQVAMVATPGVLPAPMRSIHVYDHFLTAWNFFSESSEKLGLPKLDNPSIMTSIIDTLLCGAYSEIRSDTLSDESAGHDFEAFEDLIALHADIVAMALEIGSIQSLEHFQDGLVAVDHAILAAWNSASKHEAFAYRNYVDLGTKTPDVASIKTIYRERNPELDEACRLLLTRSKKALSATEWSCEDVSIALKLIEDMLHVGGDPHRFCNVLSILARSRHFFTTDVGSLGVGVRPMQQDDIVVIFFGSKDPFVLRPTATDSIFCLVCECYVDGIMHGEFIDKLEAENEFHEAVTTFTLI